MVRSAAMDCGRGAGRHLGGGTSIRVGRGLAEPRGDRGTCGRYNLFCFRRLRSYLLWDRPYHDLRAVAIRQMLTDLGALLLVVHYTGGCHSPVLPFVVFHMAIGTIMISTRLCSLLATVTIAGALGLFALEGWILTHRHPIGSHPEGLELSCVLNAAVLMVLVFGMVYLTDTVTSRFKTRGIQLHSTSEQLRNRKEELKQLLREREESNGGSLTTCGFPPTSCGRRSGPSKPRCRSWWTASWIPPAMVDGD